MFDLFSGTRYNLKDFRITESRSSWYRIRNISFPDVTWKVPIECIILLAKGDEP